MQVVLVMFRSDGERRSFSVVRNMTVIGRREDCDLRIPVGDVSRKHCRIMTSDDTVRIEDLGSSNGTFVNHERVQQSDLQAGDTLGVGPVQFVVQINGVPDDDELVAPTAAAPMATAEDSAAEYQAPTIVDEAPVDDEITEHAPLEEMAEDELHVEELPAEELAEADPAAEAISEEDLTEEAEPLEELSEEEPEELALDEEPVEELAEAEPVEELTAEEELTFEDELELAPAKDPVAPVDELEVVGDPTKLADDSLEEFEDSGIPEEELEVESLAATPTDAESLDELEVEAKAPEPEPVAEDELDELPLPPAAHASEKIEELELDGDEPHGEPKTAEGSAWDFVIEETETEHTPHGLHIDLDAPHQQPHQ